MSSTPNRSSRRAARFVRMIGVVVALVGGAGAQAAGDELIVHKDPNCGCCGHWAEHMRAAGFSVKEIATTNMDEVKRGAGVPRKLASCHTARVGGYVIEGHVPAADVKRLLTERPKVVGLSAPGMPMGSPGMEGPYPADKYNVVSFSADGRTGVFAEH